MGATTALKTKLKVKKENKNSPWTKHPIAIDLNSSLKRTVLVEKSNPSKSLQIEMTNFFLSKLNGCELFTPRRI